MFALWIQSLAPAAGVSVIKPLTGTITNIAATSVPRRSTSVASVGTKLYFWGGYNTSAMSDMVSFDTSNNTWATLPNATPRYDNSAVAYNGLIYYFGGGDAQNSPQNSFSSFNPATNQFTALTTGPSARLGHRAVMIGSRMYLFGGANGAPFNDVWYYDMIAKTWTQVTVSGTKPVARQLFGMTAVGGKIFMGGGKDNSLNILNDFWQFDTATNTWTQIPNGTTNPGPRWLTHLVNVNGFVYSIGGTSNTAVNNAISGVWMFDLSTQKWTSIATLSAANARWSTTPIAVNDNSIYVYGGGTASGTVANTMFTIT